MKRVGVREFKEKAAALATEAEPFVIEKRGTPVGFYVPLTAKDKTDPEVKRSVERLDAIVADILERIGMTEDEFVAELTNDWEHRGARRQAMEKTERETDEALATCR